MSQKHKGSVPLRSRGKLKSSFSSSNSTDLRNIVNSQNNFDRREGIQKNEMAYRAEYINVWLWYAFDVLGDTSGRVDKSQLKMLTAHIQNALICKSKIVGSKCPNKLLNDLLENNASSMSFDDYCTFLNFNQFLELEKLDMGKLEEACWIICSTRLDKRPNQMKAISNVLKQLWKLFNFFTEPEELPPKIVKEECAILTQKLLVAMGTKWMQGTYDETAKEVAESMTFLEYLSFLEGKALSEVDQACIPNGIMQVYDVLVEEVEKVGMMKKKGHNFTTWRDRYFILKPGSLSYYVSSDLKELKGTVDLEGNWKIDILPDLKGYRNLFALVCTDEDVAADRGRYDMSAPDALTRQEWVTALKYVIKRSRKEEESDEWNQLQRRRNARKEKKSQEKEAERLKQEELVEKEKQKKAYEDLHKAHLEVSKKADEEEALRKVKEQEEAENRLKEEEHRKKTQKEIEELKAAQEDALRIAREEMEKRAAREREEVERRKIEEDERAKLMKEFKDLQDALNDAEKRASVEAALKEAEKMRMSELEDSLKQLEGLLEEERQAKKDEEIVRTLQARLLEEETEKRQELEKLQKEKEEMLKQEQEKRERLEQVSEELANQRKEQEIVLERERKRLEELELERKQAGEKLQEAMEKLLQAEEKKRQQERKKRELEKPIGLARLVQPTPDPLKSSHRGVGAFTLSQFETIRKLRQQFKDYNIIQNINEGSKGDKGTESKSQGNIDHNGPTEDPMEAHTNGEETIVNGDASLDSAQDTTTTEVSSMDNETVQE